MQSTQELMRKAFKQVVKPKAALDASTDQEVIVVGADAYAENDIAVKAIAAVQQWCETDDLDENETRADRLMAMMVGVADMNHDGEISEDEQGVLDVALNAVWDYLVAKGVSDEDAGSLLNDWDSAAADRISDLLCTALPEGDEAAAEEIDSFVFGDDDQGAVFDAAYKNVMAIRKGKKVRIKKRISGTVRLSAKQKLSIRKASMKSHSAGAMMRRMKSNKIRRRVGL